MSDFHDQLDTLQSAEDFFDFFKVPYESRVMASQRLQIMQRLRWVLRELDLAETGGDAGAVDQAALAELYRSTLARIYEECRDGTGPSSRQRKQPEPDNAQAASSFVPLTAIRRAGPKG